MGFSMPIAKYIRKKNIPPCVFGYKQIIPGMGFSMTTNYSGWAYVTSNQDPRCTQKPIYIPIFTHHSWSWLLCMYPRNKQISMLNQAAQNPDKYRWVVSKATPWFFRRPTVPRSKAKSSLVYVYVVARIVRVYGLSQGHNNDNGRR